ncbi:MarR family winged helix-turn-helix transcriptional regulator [Nocardia sp. NPDC059240]|uniref:MarR family winged helix-turn-helix transcriptional regulator n=1 Tax=Nocardia sp. NPDC059240 TaxID=3346786 RepID=UPI0036CE20C7
MPSSHPDDSHATAATRPGGQTSSPGSDDDLAELFFRSTKRLRRTQSARLAPLGLTPAQARALRIIGRFDEHADEPLRMSALADHLGIVPRSATTVVDALVTAGLVARETDPANRRATLVTPTTAGRKVLAEMSQARRDAAGEMFAALSSDQRHALRDLLATLVGDDATPPAAH